jgi:hypothetical protein
VYWHHRIAVTFVPFRLFELDLVISYLLSVLPCLQNPKITLVYSFSDSISPLFLIDFILIFFIVIYFVFNSFLLELSLSISSLNILLIRVLLIFLGYGFKKLG